MKKVLIIAAVVVGAVFYSFTTNDMNTKNLSTDSTTVLETRSPITIHNNELNSQLQKNFIRYFDEIHYVVAKYHENVGYYYDVFGTKNGLDANQGLKIDKSDIENETYTYIDFTDIKVNELTVYCKDDISKPACDCSPPPPVKACKIICAVWTGLECFPII